MKTLLLSSLGLSLGYCFLAFQSGSASDRVAQNQSQNPSSSYSLGVVASSESFIVRGNEPFWNVTINKNGIVYASPEIKKLTFPYVTPMNAQGRPADNVRVYRLQGKPSGMMIIKKVSACSDTMSDRKYAYSATLILGNNVREGCAEKK